jgi:hypothetical protein
MGAVLKRQKPIDAPSITITPAPGTSIGIYNIDIAAQSDSATGGGGYMLELDGIDTHRIY